MKAILLLVLLAGCTTADPVTVCPVQVREWSRAEQQELANVVSTFSENSIMVPVLNDYAAMRAEARTCATR